jgi:hypothetical protein
MIDQNDKEWNKWYKYVESRYDAIMEQMPNYEDENLLFTRKIAAEMGVEFTPEEVKDYARLIKVTMEMITAKREDEKNTQRETPDNDE